MTAPSNVKFSIITVSFNSEETIRRALVSLRAQTYRNHEYIVVDGASTDQTIQIVQEYSDLAPVILSEPDCGIYDAMNKGLRLATGNFIYFLNSDDALADTEVLYDIAMELSRNPRIELIYGNALYLTDQGTLHRSFEYVTKHNLIYSDLCHQAVFAHRGLFERHGCFDTGLRINADFDWLLRIFRGGAITRYFDRNIAIFDGRGRHSQDPAALERERMRVKLKYTNRAIYFFGDLWYRCWRKANRLFTISI